MTEPLSIAWLTTGRGPGSYGALEYVLDAIDGGLPVRIAVVFVNRDEGEAEATDRLIAMARDRGVPVEALSSVRYRKSVGGERSQQGGALPQWRFDYDALVAERLAAHGFQLGVMFGYMLIATPPLFERYTFVNDHPALPDGPVGTYQQVIAQLIAEGAEQSGCMMNMVSGDVDRGPVVSYCRYSIRDAVNSALWEAHRTGEENPVEESALYADIRARGVARERPFLAETLRVIAEGALVVPPARPTDLTVQVERALMRQQPG
jgi:phosphoribosylglycinamide formyltransferase 1